MPLFNWKRDKSEKTPDKSEESPDKFQEIIDATREGVLKWSVASLGGHFNTYETVIHPKKMRVYADGDVSIWDSSLDEWIYIDRSIMLYEVAAESSRAAAKKKAKEHLKSFKNLLEAEKKHGGKSTNVERA